MLVPFETLQDVFGGGSIEDVIIRLEKAQIKYIRGKRGKPFTTEFALNAAMGLTSTTMMTDQPPSVEIQ